MSNVASTSERNAEKELSVHVSRQNVFPGAIALDDTANLLNSSSEITQSRISGRSSSSSGSRASLSGELNQKSHMLTRSCANQVMG